MATEQPDWSALVRSVRANRAGKATFYKPVCVIAAIDLADIGRLDSDLLHSELIVRRFGEYVSVAFSGRAGAGWQPLLFLANDGLWTFSKKKKPLTTRDIQEAGRSTRVKAFGRFDTQAIAADYRALWNDPAQRMLLRDQMLLILARDAENRPLLRALFHPRAHDDPERWPTEDELDIRLQALSDQLDLFHAPGNGGVRRKATREALLAFKAEALPKASATGPVFLETGRTPIQLSGEPYDSGTPAQADFQVAFAGKCEHLERLAAATNRASHIVPALRGLIHALTTAASQSTSYLVWSHGNTLRRLYGADLRALGSDDPEAPPLPDRLREMLGDIVEQFNAYALLNPIVGLLDRARPGPETRARSLHSLQAGIEFVAAVRKTPDLVEPAAGEVLEAATMAAQSAQDTPGFNADQAIVNAVEIQRNGARAILVNALQEVRNVLSMAGGLAKRTGEGMAKQVGVELVKQLPIGAFVSSAHDLFVTLWKGISGSDQVQQLVRLIRDLINHLR